MHKWRKQFLSLSVDAERGVKGGFPRWPADSNRGLHPNYNPRSLPHVILSRSLPTGLTKFIWTEKLISRL